MLAVETISLLTSRLTKRMLMTKDIMETTTPDKIEKASTANENPNHEIQTEDINASGHRQQLQRNFGLLSICGVAITTGNTWVALGGSIVNHLPITTKLQMLMSSRSSRCTMVVRQALFMNCGFLFKSPNNTCSRGNSIVDSVFYWLIAASLAELASAMPSSSGGMSNVEHHICW